MSRGVTNRTLKKLVERDIYVKEVSKTLSVASGMSNASLSLNLPASAEIISASIVSNPNANWIYVSIGSCSNSSVYIAWNNTYSGAISGTFTVKVLYRL